MKQSISERIDRQNQYNKGWILSIRHMRFCTSSYALALMLKNIICLAIIASLVNFKWGH